VSAVPFADLKMDALFVKGMPDAAKPLSLPVTSVKARVVVNADGVPLSVTAFSGFAALGAPTEQALLGATFPKRGGTYAVDLDVEWRPADGE
jgi:hypothetical protein